MKGMKTVIEKHRITIEILSGPSTGFFTAQPDGSSELRQYSGHHDQEPKGLEYLVATNIYTDKLVLRRREEYAKKSIVNLFTYEYHNDAAQDGQTPASKLPMERHCIKGNLN